MPNWKKLTDVGHGGDKLIVYVNVDQVLYIRVFDGKTRLYFSGGTDESPCFIEVEEDVGDIHQELISLRRKVERGDVNTTTFALREGPTMRWRELFAVVVSLSLAAAIYFYFASWNVATLIGKFVTTGSVIK